jgi:SAM-dependent methyltransferase
LPFAANTLDCIYAISVFTHLSAAMHFAWIKELYRVLKPNGVLILTTHGVTAADRLLPEEKAGFDQGALIVRDRIREGKKHFLAYHPVGFIRERLLEGFLVLRHVETPTVHQLHQDVWIARKPVES